MGVAHVHSSIIEYPKRNLLSGIIHDITIEVIVRENKPFSLKTSGLGVMSDFVAYWLPYAAMKSVNLTHPIKSAEVEINIAPELPIIAHCYITLPLTIAMIAATNQLHWNLLLDEVLIIGNVDTSGRILPLPQLNKFLSHAYSTRNLTAMIAPQIPDEDKLGKAQISDEMSKLHILISSLAELDLIPNEIVNRRNAH